jgi:hypothetical protein
MIKEGFSKWAKDKIPGGLADKKSPKDFDRERLAQGIKVEMEHTSDKAIAREIAMDHLTEDPNYYRKLKKIEKHASVRQGGRYLTRKQLFPKNIGKPAKPTKPLNEDDWLLKMDSLGDTSKLDTYQKTRLNQLKGIKKEGSLGRLAWLGLAGAGGAAGAVTLAQKHKGQKRAPHVGFFKGTKDFKLGNK